MHDPIQTCFKGGAAGAPPPSTAAGPTLTTSVYETRLGAASLTWSRTVLGLSLRADLRLSDDEAGPPPDPDAEPLSLRVRPWLLWKRRGSKRFRLRGGRAVVHVAWDLTRARFPPGGGPEPAAGYFVAVAVDREMLLVAGDLVESAYKRSKTSPLSDPPALVTRREHVALGGEAVYRTRVCFEGKEREISIEIGGAKDARMSVAVDGRRAMHVRRLRWKFRGSERLEIDGGGAVRVSWDLHNWLFQAAVPASAAAAAAEAASAAVFAFRFEREEDANERNLERPVVCKGIGGYFGKCKNWSESSGSGGGGGGGGGEMRRRSLLLTSSSSSSSSASSTSSSSVMEWYSKEEAELRGPAGGFSLLVYAWKR